MAGIQTLAVPKWGLSMEEGTIARWLIAAGESFAQGQDICEIETSKIVNVLEAPFAGTLRRILADVGETLPVQTLIAIVADADVSDADIDRFLAQQNGQTAAADELVPEVAAEAGATEEVEVEEAAPVAVVVDTPSRPFNGMATSHARRLAQAHAIDLGAVIGSGREGRVEVQDVSAAIARAGGDLPPSRPQQQTRSSAAAVSTADDSAIAATPLARRLAKQWQINLHDCRASGDRGRVCKADVEAAQALRERSAGVVVAAPVAHVPEGVPASETLALSPMRRVIANRLQQSKQTIPHFRLSADVDMGALMTLRQTLNQQIPAAKVSLNDCLVKAVAAALMQVPEANIQFNGETIERFRDADIAIAVAIDGGLVTPIVRAANTKGLVEIADLTRNLSTRAKTGTLKLAEINGGTFTISNLGMYGVQRFDAIINPPQGAILAVGAVESRAVVRAGQIIAVDQISLTLSCDHRVIDGAVGARLLQALRRFIENPSLMVA